MAYYFIQYTWNYTFIISFNSTEVLPQNISLDSRVIVTLVASFRAVDSWLGLPWKSIATV